ncbi:hypothetical protein EYF80_041439 [Liparis tanakae]|uniref:Uncharacterized protein n=1 Tax=Liparis tanakae TaxID=230148 RepID=A0A4Z2G5F3_9TELE|nr:hypothetical protein EYF80_041439 [Liparis tanakae]
MKDISSRRALCCLGRGWCLTNVACTLGTERRATGSFLAMSFWVAKWLLAGAPAGWTSKDKRDKTGTESLNAVELISTPAGGADSGATYARRY